jgi:hypothetical protein
MSGRGPARSRMQRRNEAIRQMHAAHTASLMDWAASLDPTKGRCDPLDGCDACGAGVHDIHLKGDAVICRCCGYDLSEELGVRQ